MLLFLAKISHTNYHNNLEQTDQNPQTVAFAESSRWCCDAINWFKNIRNTLNVNILLLYLVLLLSWCLVWLQELLLAL